MVVAIILNVAVSVGKACLKHYHNGVIALVTAVFWLGVSPFLVIIAATMAGIFLLSGLVMETDGKETGNVFHVKHVQTFLSP
jgi:hypothetical protein